MLALPLPSVIETMRPLPIEHFPGTPAYISGVTTVRGVVVPVIDVAVLLGVAALPGTTSVTRFVTISLTGRTVVLAVGSVLGLRTLTDDVLHKLPPLLGSVDDDVFTSIGSLDADLLVVLDHTRLVPEPVWALLSDQVTSP